MMRVLNHVPAVLIVLVILAGCATTPPPAPPPSYAVLLENADGSVGQISVSGAKGEVLLNDARSAANLDDGAGRPYAVDQARIDRDFGAAIAAQPPLPVSFMLYFRAGGVLLTDESQALIPEILAATAKRPAPDVSVIGHTDTRGSGEANEKLALQRAEAVAELIRNAGLKVHDLTIESHGERNLLVPTPDSTPEPRNRRVEITVR